GARRADDLLHAARRDRRARRHEGDARRASGSTWLRHAEVRLLLQLRRARQRALRTTGAGPGADSSPVRHAFAGRHRELIRDRPDLRASANSHVHRRPAARWLRPPALDAINLWVGNPPGFPTKATYAICLPTRRR